MMMIDPKLLHKKRTPTQHKALGGPDRPPFLLVLVLLIHEILRACFVQQEIQFVALILRTALIGLSLGRIERGRTIISF